MHEATSFAAVFAAADVPCSQVDAQLFGNPLHVTGLAKAHWTTSVQPDVEVHVASALEQSLHLLSLQEQRLNELLAASDPASRDPAELLPLDPALEAELLDEAPPRELEAELLACPLPAALELLLVAPPPPLLAPAEPELAVVPLDGLVLLPAAAVPSPVDGEVDVDAVPTDCVAGAAPSLSAAVMAPAASLATSPASAAHA